MVVGIVAGSWNAGTWLTYYLRMVVLGFALVSVLGVFAYSFICPRCRWTLVTKATTIMSVRPCACPKCGVSLDEPAKNPANQK